MRRTTTLIAACLLACTAGCRTGGPAAPGSNGGPRAAAPSDLAVLAEWMTGSFSSAAQAAEGEANYGDIRMEMHPIWPSRADGPWLYVEQAFAEDIEKPYRQRVYRLLDQPDGAILCQVYELPGDPLAHAGAHRRPDALASLKPDELLFRGGCTITFGREPDGSFFGATGVGSCESRVSGSTFLTSHVTVTADKLVSWDRGYDANGNQKWGPTLGGYEFVKQ
jgi:hypothetical protein